MKVAIIMLRVIKISVREMIYVDRKQDGSQHKDMGELLYLCMRLIYDKNMTIIEDFNFFI